jgi:hypothetical protein
MKFHPVNPEMEEVSWQLFLDAASNTLYDGTYSHEYKSKKITDFEKLLSDHSAVKKMTGIKVR